MRYISYNSSAFFLIIAIFSATSATLSHASEVTFSKQYLVDGIIAMIELSQGGYIGSSFDHQFPVLIRFDEEGNVVSPSEYVIRSTPRAYFDNLIETRDGGIVASGIRNFKDPIIFKFDAMGRPQWQIVIPRRPNVILSSITETAEGGYVAVGGIRHTNSVESDAWVIKLNSMGRVTWSKILERPKGDAFRFVKQTLDGAYVVAGVVGAFGSMTERQLMITKLDAHGKLIWNRMYSFLENLRISAMTLTPAEGVVLVGTYEGAAFLMKVGSNGAIHWSKAFYAKPHDLSLWSIVSTKDGAYVAAGSSDVFRGPDNRGLLLKVNALGKLLWSRRTRSELFSLDQTLDHGFSLSGMGSGFYGILKTNSRGLIPGCSLLKRFPLSPKSLLIKRLENQELRLKSFTIRAESISVTPRRIHVLGEEYCN